MIRKVISGLVSLVILAILGYLIFFVPLGERTLAEHTARIAATPEAEELGEDALRASEQIEETVRTKLESEMQERQEAQDALESESESPE